MFFRFIFLNFYLLLMAGAEEKETIKICKSIDFLHISLKKQSMKETRWERNYTHFYCFCAMNFSRKENLRVFNGLNASLSLKVGNRILMEMKIFFQFITVLKISVFLLISFTLLSLFHSPVSLSLSCLSFTLLSLFHSLDPLSLSCLSFTLSSLFHSLVSLSLSCLSFTLFWPSFTLLSLFHSLVSLSLSCLSFTLLSLFHSPVSLSLSCLSFTLLSLFHSIVSLLLSHGSSVFSSSIGFSWFSLIFLIAFGFSWLFCLFSLFFIFYRYFCNFSSFAIYFCSLLLFFRVRTCNLPG
jgi:hypothetical protein